MAPSWSDSRSGDSQEPESASETQHRRRVPTNSTTLMKKIGNLARSRVVTSPHEPIWIEGMDLPVQDVIRHTRSMTSKLEHRGDTTKIIATPTCDRRDSLTMSRYLDKVKPRQKNLFPSIKNIALDYSPFCLPDKEFQTLKLLKLREVIPQAKAAASQHHFLKSNNYPLTGEANATLQVNFKSPDEKLMIGSHKISSHMKHGFEFTVHASRLGTAGRLGIDVQAQDAKHASIPHIDYTFIGDNWAREADSCPGITVLPYNGATELPSYWLTCMGCISYKVQ